MGRKCIIWGTPLIEVGSLNYNCDLKGCAPSVTNSEPPMFKVCNNRAGGQYITSDKDLKREYYNELTDNEKVRLSGFVAKENLIGNIPDLNKILKGNNWLEKIPRTPNPNEQINLFLEGLGKLYPRIGQDIYLSIKDNECGIKNPVPFLSALSYLSDSQNDGELQFLIKYLKRSRYLDESDSGLKDFFQITIEGWKHLNKNLRDSKTAFIAMWIHQDTDQIHKAIEEAVRKTGYEPVRIDKKEHNNKIDDEILSEINKSRFIICDLSSEKEKPRGGVYFEAGYALGKNIPIIWTCKKELIQDIHFDIRQYNCLDWEEDNISDFTNRLRHRIENIIGKNK